MLLRCELGLYALEGIRQGIGHVQDIKGVRTTCYCHFLLLSCSMAPQCCTIWPSGMQKRDVQSSSCCESPGTTTQLGGDDIALETHVAWHGYGASDKCCGMTVVVCAAYRRRSTKSCAHDISIQ